MRFSTIVAGFSVAVVTVLLLANVFELSHLEHLRRAVVAAPPSATASVNGSDSRVDSHTASAVHHAALPTQVVVSDRRPLPSLRTAQVSAARCALHASRAESAMLPLTLFFRLPKCGSQSLNMLMRQLKMFSLGDPTPAELDAYKRDPDDIAAFVPEFSETCARSEANRTAYPFQVWATGNEFRSHTRNGIEKWNTYRVNSVAIWRTWRTLAMYQRGVVPGGAPIRQCMNVILRGHCPYFNATNALQSLDENGYHLVKPAIRNFTEEFSDRLPSFTVLRQPVERLISNYYYVYRAPPVCDGNECRMQTIDECLLQSDMNIRRCNLSMNFLTKWFCGMHAICNRAQRQENAIWAKEWTAIQAHGSSLNATVSCFGGVTALMSAVRNVTADDWYNLLVCTGRSTALEGHADTLHSGLQLYDGTDISQRAQELLRTLPYSFLELVQLMRSLYVLQFGFNVVGVLEMLPETLIALQHALPTIFNGATDVDLKTLKYNMTKEQFVELSNGKRMSRSYTDPTAVTMELLNVLNTSDLLLYQATVSHLQSQLQVCGLGGASTSGSRM